MAAKRILLVQDDKQLANLYREKLEGSGFAVDQSRGIDQALRLIEQRQPDLVLTDVVLSAGSGVDFVRHLRTVPELAQLPVYLLPSALSQVSNAAMTAGATNIIPRGAHTVGTVVDTVKVSLGLPSLGTIAGTSLFHPDDSWNQMVTRSMPETINQMRHCLPGLVSTVPDHATLQDLWWHVHTFSEKAELLQKTPLAQFAGALDTLLCDLVEMPEQINPSVLRSVGQGVDFLATLAAPANINRGGDCVRSSILIVDDEESARQFIRSAMEMAGLSAESVGTPGAAIEKLSKTKCELIFLDVGMPEMNGFDLCSRIRGFEIHEKTPIVFLTGMATFQNRAQASLSGGNDFVGKPFNLAELGLKAMLWIFRAQLGLL